MRVQGLGTRRRFEMSLSPFSFSPIASVSNGDEEEEDCYFLFSYRPLSDLMCHLSTVQDGAGLRGEAGLPPR